MSELFLITFQNNLFFEEITPIVSQLGLVIADIHHVRMAVENNDDMINNTPFAYINDGNIVRITQTDIIGDNMSTDSVFVIGYMTPELIQEIEDTNGFIIRHINTGGQLNNSIIGQNNDNLIDVLMYMNDEELLKTCQTNMQINSLCNEHIWKRKLQMLFNRNLIELLETLNYTWIYMYFSLKDVSYFDMDFVLERAGNNNDFTRMIIESDEFITRRNYIWANYIVVHDGDISDYNMLVAQLNSLQESDKLLVIGDINLSENQLTSLPESFGNLRINGKLILTNNRLKSLPESFSNIQISNDLYLVNNSLTTLPESFGNIQVGMDLVLTKNLLTSLPESFGNLKLNRNLFLSYNKLTRLPESFGKLKIGRNLFLVGNSLTSLPESFDNIQIGGILNLLGNHDLILSVNFGDNIAINGDIIR